MKGKAATLQIWEKSKH